MSIGGTLVNKLNCWDFNNCGRAFEDTSNSATRTCPASVEIMLDGIHGGARAGRACWIIKDTLCKGKTMGAYSQKQSSCQKCDFYKAVKKQEGASFMSMAHMLEIADSGSPALRSRKGIPTDNLEKIFHTSLLDTLQKGENACGYSEARLLHMIKDLGPMRAIKKVLNKQQFLYGTSELAKHNCLHLSVERLVLDYRYSDIFSEEERLTALLRIKNTGADKLGELLSGSNLNADNIT